MPFEASFTATKEKREPEMLFKLSDLEKIEEKSILEDKDGSGSTNESVRSTGRDIGDIPHNLYGDSLFKKG